MIRVEWMKHKRQHSPFAINGIRGSVLLHLVVILVVAGIIGAAMISFMSTSVNQQVFTGMSNQADLIAESGFRYLTAAYKAPASEIAKNTILKTYHGRTFVLDDNDGRFSLNIQPYFYTARSDHAAGAATLACEFPGVIPGGVTIPSSGYLGILAGGAYNLYSYSTLTGTASGFSFGGIVFLKNGSSGLDGVLLTGATVHPVMACETKVLSNGSGNTLTVYNSNNQMPPENGVFEIITNSGDFTDALGTKTDIYTYVSRTGTTLYNITKFNDPTASFSLNLNANTRIVIHRSARITSTGTVQAGTDLETNRTFTVMAGLGDTLFTISASDLIYDNPDNTLTGLIDGSTVVGDADVVSNGKVGDAMVFDGDHDYVTIADDPSLDLTNAGSIGAWIKPFSFSNNFSGIIRKGSLADNSDAAYELRMRSNERVHLEVFGTSTTYALDSTTRLVAGTWYHVAGTWGPAGMYIYIDGKQDAYSSVIAVAGETDGTVQIGAQLTEDFNPAQGNFAFDGIIDEVFIYDTQENLCGIRDIYSNPCNVGCDAAAYYSMTGNGMDSAGEDKVGDRGNDTYDGNVFIGAGPSLTSDRFGCADQGENIAEWQYLEAATESTFDFSGPFTVAAWVRIHSYSLLSDSAPFVAKGTNSFRLQRSNSTNNADFGTNGLSRVDTRGNDNINNGSWHHLVGVYDGSRKYLYVDGAVDASDNVSGSLSLNNSRMRMGTFSFLSLYNYDIDDVGFWGRALSSDEVTNIYNGLRTNRSLP